MKKLIIITMLLTIMIACEDLIFLDDIPVSIESGQINISDLTATMFGSIVSAGDGVTQYGHVWSTTELDPIYTDVSTKATRILNSGDTLTSHKDFISTLEMENGTVYKIRAYAVDTYGSPPYYGRDTTIATAEATMADFSFENDNCFAACTIEFTDESQNASSWSWDFGDGNTSNLPNPLHEYTSAGNFTVRLEVTGSGGTNAIEKIVVIRSRTFEQSFELTTTGISFIKNEMPVISLSDSAYIIGTGVVAGNFTHSTQLNRFEVDGSLSQEFNYHEEDFFTSLVCLATPYLREHNNDILGFKEECFPCEKAAFQLDPFTADISEPLFTRGIETVYHSQTCIKIIPHNANGFTSLYRVCTGLGTDDDADQSKVYAVTDRYFDIAFACAPTNASGDRELARDGIIVGDNLIITGTVNGSSLMLASDPDITTNSGGGLPLIQFGLDAHDPVRIEQLDDGQFLIVGNWIDNGLFALTLDNSLSLVAISEIATSGLTVTDVLINGDGSFIITGENGDSFLAQFSGGAGSYAMDWSRTEFSATKLHNIDRAKDGGFIISGSNGQLPYIIKTDPQGRID